MKTIHIVGGGLAGLSLGICLRHKNIPVTIYEKGNYPRHKVCGEFISGISPTTLSSLGIASCLSDAPKHDVMHWSMGSEHLLTEKLPTPAWCLSRYTLDHRLAEKFQQLGGDLHTGNRKVIAGEQREGYVWAAGKSTGKPNKQPQWIGLKIHAVNIQLQDLHMHSSTSHPKGGYFGMAPIENNRVNCCGLFHVRPSIKPIEAKKKWASPAAIIMEYARACGMHLLLDTLQSWQFDADSLTTTAGFELGNQSDQHAFSIGDAAWLIPPFTGNGMSMAMESSAIAAIWLEKYANGRISWAEATQAYRHDTKQHFSRRMKLSQIMHPLLFNFAGQQALKASSKASVLPFQSIFNQLRTP